MLFPLKDNNTVNDETILAPPRGRAKVVRHAFELLLQRTQRRVKAGTRSPATLAMQRQHVRYLLERVSPRTPLERLTPARIAQVLQLEERGRRGRQLSGGTLRKRASTLKQALELAGRRPRLPEIPYEYVPAAEHLADYAAYCKLRDALPANRRAWFVVAVWTGQRSSDVERMRREDLDCDARWVRIRAWKTRRRRPGGRFYAAPELVAELADHWRALPKGAKLVAAWPHVSSQLTRLAARLGLPRTTAHRLRHTFFTWFVQANGFTAELLELGGWKDLTMPSRVYAHAAPIRVREQIERTHRLVVERRSSPKTSRKREREPAAPGAVPSDAGSGQQATGQTPKPAHEDHASQGQDAIVALPVGGKPVGAEGIEPSTNGLRGLARRSQPDSRAAASAVGSRGERPCEGHPPNASTNRSAGCAPTNKTSPR
jgi:integrase